VRPIPATTMTIHTHPPLRPPRARTTAFPAALLDAFRLRAAFDSVPGLLFDICEPPFVGLCSWLGREALEERC